MPNIETIRREVENEFNGWRLTPSIVDSLVSERFGAKLAREIREDAIRRDVEDDVGADYRADYESEE